MFNLSVSDSLYVAHHGIPKPILPVSNVFVTLETETEIRRPAIVSGIVAGDAPVSYWLIFSLSLVTVPEVFTNVNSTQFSSRF